MLSENISVFIAFGVLMLGISMLIMILTQMVSTLLSLRGKNLAQGIQILFSTFDPILKPYAKAISQAVLQHPLVSDRAKWLGKGWKAAHTIRLQELTDLVETLADTNSQVPWQQHLGEKLDEVKTHLSQWFDSTMHRASQRFTGHMRLCTIVLSIIVAFAMHLNTFRILQDFSTNPEITASLNASLDAMLQQAESLLGEADEASGTARLTALQTQAETIQRELQNSKFQLVPTPYPGLTFTSWRDFLGVLMSAALLSLGAPFWFNFLKTAVSLRPLLAGVEDEEREQRTQPNTNIVETGFTL